MSDMFVLFAQGYGLTPMFPENEQEVREYVEKCSNHGVTRVIASGPTPILVEVAHEHGISVDTYKGVNTYGMYKASYEMSIEYALPYLGAPETREILDNHRPISTVRNYSLNFSDPFAEQNRRYWNKTKDGRVDPLLNERVSLSFGFPEVRDHEASLFINATKQAKSDGTQMEFVLMNMDEDGINNFGYEDPIVDDFKKQFGKDPFSLPNDDVTWLQHRADYTTSFVRNLRDKLLLESPGTRLTATVIAREPRDYLNVFHDWPTWVNENLIDEFYIWFRTTKDLNEVERQTKHAAEIVNGRVPLIAEISCYHPGSFQEPDILLEAATVARSSGADAIGLYRTHAVEQLNLWPVVEKIREI